MMISVTLSLFSGRLRKVFLAFLLYLISYPAIAQDEWIDFIVENNFSQTQGASSATNTWFNFWALSLHNEGLHRLQCINHKRLERNLAFSYRKLLKPEQVKNAAASTAALIDGYWLRYSMGSVGNGDFSEAVARCKQYVRDLVAQYGR